MFLEIAPSATPVVYNIQYLWGFLYHCQQKIKSMKLASFSNHHELLLLRML
jgi:hypothetical protein